MCNVRYLISLGKLQTCTTFKGNAAYVKYRTYDISVTICFIIDNYALDI